MPTERRSNEGIILPGHMPAYIYDLLEFLDGRRDWRTWNEWWEVHRDAIKRNEKGHTYHAFQESPEYGAWVLMEWRGIASVTTHRYPFCPECGEELFEVMPGTTTQAEIRDFARRGRLEAREDILRSGWMHPGRYCECGHAERIHLGNRPIHYPPGD